MLLPLPLPQSYGAFAYSSLLIRWTASTLWHHHLPAFKLVCIMMHLYMQMSKSKHTLAATSFHLDAQAWHAFRALLLVTAWQLSRMCVAQVTVTAATEPFWLAW